MSLRHRVPSRTGELPVDNLGLEIDSRGYLIEEMRRWPVITASPLGQYSKQIQNFEGKACSDEKTLPVNWSG